MLSDATECKCGGKGSYGYTTPPGPVRPLGDGLTIQQMEGYRTALCECRRNLPPRDGKAAWWTAGAAYSETYKGTCDWFSVTVSLTPELPVSADNYPLRRTRENSYYPASVSIAIDGDPLVSSDLRELAAFLVRMADKADEIDVPTDGWAASEEAPDAASEEAPDAQ